MSEPPGISHGTSQFDDKQPLKLAGTLTKVEWNNPRIWYYLDVKNPDGTTTTWGLSGGAPGQLMRRGTRKDLQCTLVAGVRDHRQARVGERWLFEYVCQENNRCPGGKCGGEK